ncbi:MAG TPA: hypothetical protein VGO00_20980, partial [Kofleriaceae bacterium]|nr:hypothetical protein [Kofleriaceae bacterium]
ASPTLSLAACAARAGHRDEAIAGYKRGIEMLATATSVNDKGLRGRARYDLAKLLWPSDKDASHALAAVAVTDLAESSPEQAQAKAWLTSH